MQQSSRLLPTGPAGADEPGAEQLLEPNSALSKAHSLLIDQVCLACTVAVICLHARACFSTTKTAEALDWTMLHCMLTQVVALLLRCARAVLLATAAARVGESETCIDQGSGRRVGRQRVRSRIIFVIHLARCLCRFGAALLVLCQHTSGHVWPRQIFIPSLYNVAPPPPHTLLARARAAKTFSPTRTQAQRRAQLNPLCVSCRCLETFSDENNDTELDHEIQDFRLRLAQPHENNACPPTADTLS